VGYLWVDNHPACRRPFVGSKGYNMTRSNEKPTDKPSIPQFTVTQNEDPTKNGSFVAVPRFWVDEFFGPNCHYELRNGDIRKGTRVPASFWKYTLHLWRWLSLPHTAGKTVTFTTDIAMDQFPVRSDAAVLWTAAYSVSGVVEVELGRWTARHDQSTVFTYRPETTHAEWRCFLNALDLAYNMMQDAKKTQRISKGEIGTNVGGWRVLVAREVDNCRKKAGLPPVNESFLVNALRDKDREGRHICYQDDQHVIQPYFHATVRRRLRGETDEEYECRVAYEERHDRDRGF
jgi:hypothetical protein